MQIEYNKLKTKDVISLADGKNLGKVCNLIYDVPQNCVSGYMVTGGKGFSFMKTSIFIDVCDVVKIGEDCMLVKTTPTKCDNAPRAAGAKSGKNANCPDNISNSKGRCQNQKMRERSFEEYD
jgi:sporulation protein YlmC with PRC-barrel domain